jgi:hypothetical protein
MQVEYVAKSPVLDNSPTDSPRELMPDSRLRQKEDGRALFHSQVKIYILNGKAQTLIESIDLLKHGSADCKVARPKIAAVLVFRTHVREARRLARGAYASLEDADVRIS